MDAEKLIFALYKDQALDSRKQLEMLSRRKGLILENYRDVYVKIHNYQVDKYGGKLTGFDMFEDNEKKSINAYKRRNAKYKTKEWF